MDTLHNLGLQLTLRHGRSLHNATPVPIRVERVDGSSTWFRFSILVDLPTEYTARERVGWLNTRTKRAYLQERQPTRSEVDWNNGRVGPLTELLRDYLYWRLYAVVAELQVADKRPDAPTLAAALRALNVTDIPALSHPDETPHAG